MKLKSKMQKKSKGYAFCEDEFCYDVKLAYNAVAMYINCTFIDMENSLIQNRLGEEAKLNIFPPIGCFTDALGGVIN